jgi:uncharacterized protein
MKTHIQKLIGAFTRGLLVAGCASGILRGQAAETAGAVAQPGTLAFHSCDGARFHFDGVLGERVAANRDNWLLRAPQANPGMLEMFRVRDRAPTPNIMPWAGEFVGKYLISAIQALRMSDQPALSQQVSNVVAELIATQAEDGYLGPFPKATRLKANWDLWGHYHVMQALMMWHEATADPASLAACRRAGDLICKTFLDTPQRVFDAGSPEMNMAVIHGLGQLYRLTGEARYLRMMREVEKDWERAGDYLRSGLSGLEYFQSPRPRWESLHDVQGLVELYRITGEARYRQAFEHHWRSIARWDRHNTGAFSSGEQATGNPYSPEAIETCCTVAWMALTVDMLRLTGDPLCADELELTTFNGGVGAQHPSGRWWTYNTPMDGAREASAHTIVFQARAGTPELNCCSVNAPRVLGMLSEWAVLEDEEGLAVNYYGPGSFQGRRKAGTRVDLRWDTDYPRSGKVMMHIDPQQPATFRVKFRVPAWSARARASVNGGPMADVKPGSYFAVSRQWASGDTVQIELDMGLRFVTGDREAGGRVSVYRGPLLLAYDQRYNAFDENAIPALDLARLQEARPAAVEEKEGLDPILKPWVLLEVPTPGGRNLRLCDFASAGAAGTRYRSWLAAEHCPPPPVVTRAPQDQTVIPAGPTLFRWTGPTRPNEHVTEYQLVVAPTPDFAAPSLTLGGLRSNFVVLGEEQLKSCVAHPSNYWKVVAINAWGKTDSVRPPARFAVNPALPALPVRIPSLGPDGLLTRADLRGTAEPAFGRLVEGGRFQPAAGVSGAAGQAIRLDGESQKITYAIGEFPEEDFSVAVWVRIDRMPSGRLGEIFSAWCVPMDDPLRVCVEDGKLFARIEAGQGYGTAGLAIEPGQWRHVAAVKARDRLTLYLDGKPGPTVAAPLFVHSSSEEVALGGNPRHAGNEFLAAAFADFRLYGRALSAAEIVKAATREK